MLEVVAGSRPNNVPNDKEGMTADEREELIIKIARDYPRILFNYTTFPDGSLGLYVKHTTGYWIDLRCPEDWFDNNPQDYDDVPEYREPISVLCRIEEA